MFEETNAIVLSFGPTEVLLDSQGGRSVFKAQSLLHDVSELEKPYNLGGIDASGVRGQRINHSGYFRDFEKLGCSVGCSTKTSANVLFLAECVDRGYHVDYSSSKWFTTSRDWSIRIGENRSTMWQTWSTTHQLIDQAC